MRLTTMRCRLIRDGIYIARALRALEIPLPMYLFGTRHPRLVQHAVVETWRRNA